jgi:hypothetical protein
MGNMTEFYLLRLSSIAATPLCFILPSCKGNKKTGDYSGVGESTSPNTNLFEEEFPLSKKPPQPAPL